MIIIFASPPSHITPQPSVQIIEPLRAQIEQYYHQTPSSDGEVFTQLRRYKEAGLPEFAEEWRTRLSGPKKACLRVIQKRDGLLQKLDQLRVFPGLWKDFQLGNFQKYVALHCEEEMMHYLQHVYQTWATITVNEPSLQHAVDAETVRYLELRTPVIDRTDAAKIQELIMSGSLFMPE